MVVRWRSRSLFWGVLVLELWNYCHKSEGSFDGMKLKVNGDHFYFILFHFLEGEKGHDPLCQKLRSRKQSDRTLLWEEASRLGGLCKFVSANTKQ